MMSATPAPRKFTSGMMISSKASLNVVEGWGLCFASSISASNRLASGSFGFRCNIWQAACLGFVIPARPLQEHYRLFVGELDRVGFHSRQVTRVKNNNNWLAPGDRCTWPPSYCVSSKITSPPTMEKLTCLSA